MIYWGRWVQGWAGLRGLMGGTQLVWIGVTSREGNKGTLGGDPERLLVGFWRGGLRL